MKATLSQRGEVGMRYRQRRGRDDVRWHEPASAADWNAAVLAAPGQPSMFQSFEFGQAKRTSGWTPRYAEVNGVAVTVHTRAAPGLGPVWYLPKGPSVATVEQFESVVGPLRAEARAEGAFLLKTEPELIETPDTLAALDHLGLLRAGRVQTNVSTVLVDISGDDHDLLDRLPAKTRNTIRRGHKLGASVQLAPPTTATYERMWDLWMQVVADQKLAPREHDYQVNLWRTFCDAGLGQIFICQHEGRDVSAAFVTVFGEMACYRDGASVRDRPIRGASHIVQWAAMRWARDKGATVYDMAGTPHSSKVDDRSDPYFGIGEFKRSFHKQVTDWVGAYDAVLRPGRYAVWERFGHRIVANLVDPGKGSRFY